MIFVFWMLSFKPTFSLSSFTFIRRLFSSSSLSVIRVAHITTRCKEYSNNSKNGDNHNFTNILELHNQPVCLSKSISSYFPTWNPSSHFTQSSHTCHFCSFDSYSFKCGQKALLGPSALLEVAPGHRWPSAFPLWLWTYRALSSCQVVWRISFGENNLTSWKDICSSWVLGYSKL